MLGEKYLELVNLERFTVYCDLAPVLRDAINGLNPIYMLPIGGFSRFNDK